ncbi:MAG TPA: sulfur carrier protein ThiS [Candidatus Polarisedimenticolia bacterium]|nr:sulfur carrier protein ThiS [Candidatus Polarisedimenticolia bacterium]
MIDVTVNGEACRLEEGATLSSLLALLRLEAARLAVERNRRVVPRNDYAGTLLEDGDRIEVVAFVGGG